MNHWAHIELADAGDVEKRHAARRNSDATFWLVGVRGRDTLDSLRAQVPKWCKDVRVAGEPVKPQLPPLPPCPGGFAAITCFFNPCRYRRPLANFHRFADGMEKALVEWRVIELSFDGAFEIPESLNPIRMQTDQVLWHKETLLNILANSLPKRITKIAWLDSDIIFDRLDWPALADAALQKHNVIQLFREAIRLNPDDTEESHQHSAAWAHATGQPDKVNFGKWHPGFAWAARRELWAHGGLFDLHLTGGGDSLMADSFMQNRRENIARAYGPAVHSAWQPWNEQAGGWCNGRLGFVDATLTHLWHGDRVNRNYWKRIQCLQDLNLDGDIERGADGLLKWKRPRKECKVRELVEDFFPSRKEDGEPNP